MYRRAVLPAALLAVALAACSAPEPTGASGAAPATQIAAPDRTILTANSTAKLGTVVIDGLGWTLYRSDADSAKPPRSACVGSCTDEWPPVLMQAGDPASQGAGPAGAGPGTPGGGRPGRGAVDGQGAQGSWWAVTPTGGKAAASPA